MVKTRKEQLATAGGDTGDTIEISGATFIFAPNATGGGGGGGENLSQTLDNGNTTDGYNISLSDGDDIRAPDGYLDLNVLSGGTNPQIIRFKSDGTDFLTFNPAASIDLNFSDSLGPVTIRQLATAGAGNTFTIHAQTSTGSAGGDLMLCAGYGGSGSNGGSVGIEGGDVGGGGAAGGSVNIVGGGGTADGEVGGSINITAGSITGTTSGAIGGDVTITAGSVGSGTSGTGTVRLVGASSSGSASGGSIFVTTGPGTSDDGRFNINNPTRSIASFLSPITRDEAILRFNSSLINKMSIEFGTANISGPPAFILGTPTSAGTGGDISVIAGSSDSSGTGGTLNLTGGNTVGGTGGNVNIDGGAGSTDGYVAINGLIYPDTDGTNGQVLTTNGAGVLSFTTVSGGGGGGESLFETLANGNSTDGYDIDFNSGSALISSDGNVTINDNLDVFGDGYISGQLTIAGLVDFVSGSALISSDGNVTINDNLDVFGDGYISGKLTVVGLIDPTGLVLEEQSTVPGGTPSAGNATLWVRDTDGYLILTDDTGEDNVISSGGGGGGTAGDINEISETTTDGYIEDYNPTGGFDENAIENLIEFDGYSGGTTITGIIAPSKSIRISIVNVNTTGLLTFLADDPSSSAANRILMGGGVTSVVLDTDDVATFVYSTLSNRWRIT